MYGSVCYYMVYISSVFTATYCGIYVNCSIICLPRRYQGPNTKAVAHDQWPVAGFSAVDHWTLATDHCF